MMCAGYWSEVQHQLFNLGGELSIPGSELLKAEAVLVLDQALEKIQRTIAQTRKNLFCLQAIAPQHKLAGFSWHSMQRHRHRHDRRYRATPPSALWKRRGFE
jgi:hypothetical protein